MEKSVLGLYERSEEVIWMDKIEEKTLDIFKVESVDVDA